MTAWTALFGRFAQRSRGEPDRLRRPAGRQSDRQPWLIAMLLGAALAIGFWVCAIPSHDALITLLEQRFPRADIGNGHGIAGVIALGGNADRIQEAARLGRRYPHLQLVVTGAGSRAEILSIIGPHIDPDRVLVEEAAHNTYQNAAFASGMIRSASGDKWLLVTSASHMPRAMGTFRKAGVHVVAWPIFDLDHPRAPVEGVIRHETLGLLAYWVLGRTDALWPDSVQSPAASTSVARVLRHQHRKS